LLKEIFINVENGVDFFTPAEQLLLIKKDLDNLRAGDKDSIIPGHPEAELYPGKSILRRFISSELIDEHYSLHDREDLDKLRASWLRNKVARRC
jgi:anoctamin-10